VVIPGTQYKIIDSCCQLRSHTTSGEFSKMKTSSIYNGCVSWFDVTQQLMYSDSGKSVTADIQQEQTDGYDNTGSSAGYDHLTG
jgi:hypothetical protein